MIPYDPDFAIWTEKPTQQQKQWNHKQLQCSYMQIGYASITKRSDKDFIPHKANIEPATLK